MSRALALLLAVAIAPAAADGPSYSEFTDCIDHYVKKTWRVDVSPSEIAEGALNQCGPETLGLDPPSVAFWEKAGRGRAINLTILHRSQALPPEK